ncbi:hypothetical protein BTJ39_17525 [Izhakiella australiensis]|uniref:YecA family protein n=1 Tax=Izhakiella australiensis TaxID=1926881 RepID=A0A1S8YIW7_9GAMM|nr:YecA family protein [Izhakiella australiensis]OON38656.1 hypothetical protein BTJ39_17525 [Izhakiella australiensis]
MKEGPLTDKELQWLEELLEKYGNDDSILDVAELDGMLTAILSGPTVVPPSEWLVALWGGEKKLPSWSNEREMSRFLDLSFQHMNDIADRLNHYSDQFDPLFGVREMDGQEFTIAEEWCFGYMRGVALRDWSSLPPQLQPALETIALHGTEENFERLDDLSPEEMAQSIEAIRPAAIALHSYWVSQPEQAPEQPIVLGNRPGRNDPCPCGSGKKYKQCCLH